MRQAYGSTALLIVAVAYWYFVARAGGVREPWDAQGYWRLWYPVSLLLSGVGGVLLVRRGWLAGVVVTFAQVPIVVRDGGGDNLWIAGVVTLCLLTLPAALVSALAAMIAARSGRPR